MQFNYSSSQTPARGDSLLQYFVMLLLAPDCSLSTLCASILRFHNTHGWIGQSSSEDHAKIEYWKWWELRKYTKNRESGFVMGGKTNRFPISPLKQPHPQAQDARLVVCETETNLVTTGQGPAGGSCWLETAVTGEGISFSFCYCFLLGRKRNLSLWQKQSNKYIGVTYTQHILFSWMMCLRYLESNYEAFQTFPWKAFLPSQWSGYGNILPSQNKL